MNAITVEEFLELTFWVDDTNPDRRFEIRPKVYCSDGHNVSVQGHCGSYSKPREFSPKYLNVELGYPSSEDKLFKSEFSDGDDIAGYVPINIVHDYIQSHGGVDVKTTLKKCKDVNMKKQLMKYIIKDKLDKFIK